MLRPFEIQLIDDYLLYPYPKPKKEAVNPPPPPLYFAGEAISYTHGWIQGALESGLRAAYQFYSHNENFYGPANRLLQLFVINFVRTEINIDWCFL